MINYMGPGKVMEFTASGEPEDPTDPVVFSGSAYLIGNLLVVATADALDGAKFNGMTEGVFESMPKATGQTWSEGELLYWDDDAKKLTTTDSEGNIPVGCAALEAGSGDTIGTARLSGVPGTPVLAIET